uniref:Uncharacterized protein n=1 Tax=Laticauda laticaudata TaxID=8630 RepID=A0A8C5RWX1_LATLA
MEMGGSSRIPYDDYPVVFLPPYENPPTWIPPHERIYHSDYNNELTQFLPRTIILKKPSGAQVRLDSFLEEGGWSKEGTSMMSSQAGILQQFPSSPAISNGNCSTVGEIAPWLFMGSSVH